MVKPPTPKPSIIAFADGNSALDVKLQIINKCPKVKKHTTFLRSMHVFVTTINDELSLIVQHDCEQQFFI